MGVGRGKDRAKDGGRGDRKMYSNGLFFGHLVLVEAIEFLISWCTGITLVELVVHRGKHNDLIFVIDSLNFNSLIFNLLMANCKRLKARETSKTISLTNGLKGKMVA